MTNPFRRPALIAALLAGILGVLAGACTNGASGGLSVESAWARTSPAMTSAGAAYMRIVNDGDVDDALISASVDASVAARVEIHETVVAGSMSMGASPGSGMMEMRPVERIEVAAGETLVLEPGGYHLMLLQLAEPLEVGTTIEITLTFEEAGEMSLPFEVRDAAP